MTFPCRLIHGDKCGPYPRVLPWWLKLWIDLELRA